MTDSLKKTCANCQGHFGVDQAQLDFLRSVSPKFGEQVMLIPPPQLCPACRLQRRLAFRNPIHVGWRTSAQTSKKILSAFLLEDRAKVIENELWWSDSWSALDFGRGYDFTRDFFSQFEELRRAVPYAAKLQTSSENSEYCSNANDLKDCYFVFNTHQAEDSLYCDYIWWSKSCVDCTRAVRCELCYDCLEITNCYGLQSSEFCSGCRDSFFLSQCLECSECFGCVNLVHKRFHIFNQPYSERDYREFLSQLDLCSFQQRAQYHEKWRALVNSSPRPHLFARRVEDCSGNYIENSARVFDSFFVIGGEDLRFCFVVNNETKNCYDFSHFGNKCENLYECQTVGHDAVNMLFSRDCWNANSDLIYCASCFGCQNCFGCVGLRKKQYCLFNVQYSREEYEDLVVRVIRQMERHRQWGEFFPIESSPFPYNQSFAARYFPLSEAQARERGLGWLELAEADSRGAMLASQLPDGLPESDVALTVLSQCSGRPFKITAQELRRYRHFGAPLPRISSIERMEQRWKRLGGIQFFKRASAYSGLELNTSFDSDIAPILWSKEEWEKEVR